MRSPSVARESTFTDIDFGLRVIPSLTDDDIGTGDIAKKRDVEAISQACINILLTNRGEKPFDPFFGSNIRGQLFELYDPAMRLIFQEEIKLSLKRYEPRVKVLDVYIKDLSDRNALDFRVEVEIKSPEPSIEEIAFVVERLR